MTVKYLNSSEDVVTKDNVLSITPIDGGNRLVLEHVTSQSRSGTVIKTDKLLSIDGKG